MNEYTGKKLMLIGGVRPACEIVYEAKRMGIETFVTDYLENSPAKKIADHAFMVDATDVDSVVELCKEQNIDGIITGYVDMLLPYCQKICDKLGKPFWGNAENIDMSINKVKFKLACERSGVPIVPWRMANKDNYLEIINTVTPPVVVKPVDNSGSRGVYKCTDISNLKECAARALEFSKCGEILIEKTMDTHHEFSAYYILNQGQCYLTGLGDRYVNDADKDIAPIAQGMLLPSVHLNQWIEQIDPCIKKFFHDNDMKDGFVFLQGFYDNGSFYIHEMGYRLNGGFSYKIIEYFSKYNQIQELIKFSIVGEMDKFEVQKSNPFYDGYGMIITISLKPGTIKEVSGIEEIENTNGVLKFYQLHDIGEKLISRGTTAQYFAYVLCATKTKEEMNNIIRVINENLVVNNINDESMLNPVIEAERIRYES